MILAQIALTDAAILAGVVVFAIVKLAEVRGWTRSPALVRQENADLRERNATLEADVARLDDTNRKQGERIAALEALVEELKKRDQAAVLVALKEHEAHAQARHTENVLRDDRSLEVLSQIRDSLNRNSNG